MVPLDITSYTSNEKSNFWMVKNMKYKNSFESFKKKQQSSVDLLCRIPDKHYNNINCDINRIIGAQLEPLLSRNECEHLLKGKQYII